MTKNQKADDLECSIRDVGPTKIAQMIILGWPWPTLLHVLKVNLHFDLSSNATNLGLPHT